MGFQVFPDGTQKLVPECGRQKSHKVAISVQAVCLNITEWTYLPILVQYKTSRADGTEGYMVTTG